MTEATRDLFAVVYAPVGRYGDPLSEMLARVADLLARQALVAKAGGNMALLSSEHVDVAICTRRNQTFHADAFRAVGAEPADYRVVVVKSAQHFYNGFVGLAKEILYVATPGGADPDVTRKPYTKRKTPFWPKVADPWK